jgi:hypothetical protein
MQRRQCRRRLFRKLMTAKEMMRVKTQAGWRLAKRPGGRTGRLRIDVAVGGGGGAAAGVKPGGTAAAMHRAPLRRHEPRVPDRLSCPP